MRSDEDGSDEVAVEADRSAVVKIGTCNLSSLLLIGFAFNSPRGIGLILLA